MKGHVLLLILLADAASALAQGTVDFRNAVMFQTIDPSGGARKVYNVGSPLNPATGQGLFGTQWVAELYVGNDASSLDPLTASISRFTAATTTVRGVWATFGIYGPNGAVVLPGFDVNSTPTLQVRVWDFSKFATYEAAVASGITGASIPFTYQVPDPANNPSPTAYYMEGLQAFALVPEPSAIALGILGAAALLSFTGRDRRRRRAGELAGSGAESRGSLG